MSTDDTSTHPQEPIEVSSGMLLTFPVVLMVTIIIAAAVAYSAWSEMRTQVLRNTSDIKQIKVNATANREILIRIDENVRMLKAKNNP